MEDDLSHLADGARVEELAPKVVRYLQENGPTGTRTLQKKLTDNSQPMKKALERALALPERLSRKSFPGAWPTRKRQSPAC